MKGDFVRAQVRAGVGVAEVLMMVDVGGRSVAATTEKDSGISWLVIKEETRGGTVVREARIQMTDVIYWEKINARTPSS